MSGKMDARSVLDLLDLTLLDHDATEPPSTRCASEPMLIDQPRCVCSQSTFPM